MRSTAFFSDNEREEGSNRMAKLIFLLSEQSRNEDLLKAAKEAGYREVLLKELNI